MNMKQTGCSSLEMKDAVMVSKQKRRILDLVALVISWLQCI